MSRFYLDVLVLDWVDTHFQLKEQGIPPTALKIYYSKWHVQSSQIMIYVRWRKEKEGREEENVTFPQ